MEYMYNKLYFSVLLSKGYLGSSLGYGKGKCPDETSPVCDIDGGPNGMFSSNVSINPMMHNWNRVFINYCGMYT